MTDSITKYRWLLMFIGYDMSGHLKIEAFMRKKDMKRVMKDISGDMIIFKKVEHIKAKDGNITLEYEDNYYN